ncbi:hypothetical protein ABTD24_18375, partial [Acinetobacter baumannii]
CGGAARHLQKHDGLRRGISCYRLGRHGCTDYIRVARIAHATVRRAADELSSRCPQGDHCATNKTTSKLIAAYRRYFAPMQYFEIP